MNPSPSLAWPTTPRNEGHACVVNIVMHALSVYHLPRACLVSRSLEGRKRVYQLTHRAHQAQIRPKIVGKLLSAADTSFRIRNRIYTLMTQFRTTTIQSFVSCMYIYTRNCMPTIVTLRTVNSSYK